MEFLSAIKKILQLAVSECNYFDKMGAHILCVTEHIRGSLSRDPLSCHFYQLPAVFWHVYKFTEACTRSKNTGENDVLPENSRLAKRYEGYDGSSSNPRTVWWIEDLSEKLKIRECSTNVKINSMWIGVAIMLNTLEVQFVVLIFNHRRHFSPNDPITIALIHISNTTGCINPVINFILSYIQVN